MPEPIRLLDGPGVDAAAAKLRESGLEVQIIAPTKTLQLWRYLDCYVALVDAGTESKEADAIRDEMDAPWLEMGDRARVLWRRLVDSLAAHPWIDPEIVDLVADGVDVEAALMGDSGAPTLVREKGDAFGFRWLLTLAGRDDRVDEAEVSERFAAAWIAEFGGSK